MSLKEAQARIKSRVWQNIAQTNLDVSALDQATLESLVDLVTDAALMELDEEVGKSLASEAPAAEALATDEHDDDEKILWQGRPLLSLTLHYTITSERIKISAGLLGKAYENVELIRVQDVDHSQALSERLLNIGDITVRSHDSSHPLIELKNVREPERVFEILRRAVLEARRRHNFSYREEM